MARKRHIRRAPPPRVAAAPGTPTKPPRAVVVRNSDAPESWWFDFSIDRRHLALFRLCFFGVLAVDAFMQISHAPRYGAGELNVPHLSWLDLGSPGREAMLGLDVLLAYLFAMAALGVATRVVVPLAAALDFYGYFSSQLDSYQHHYLVVMLLICASFVPWHERGDRIRSWALRLFTVELAILYLWAAIAKLDPRWLDGTALDRQLRPTWIRDLLDVVPGHAGTMAKAILVGELILGVAWLWRRTWPFALGLGVVFHVGVELAGFQIGQFSFVMLAIYVLMIPESVAAGLGAVPGLVAAGLPKGPGLGGVVLALGVCGGVLAWLVVPLPVSALVIGAATAIAIGAFVFRPTWAVGSAHLGALGLIAVLAFATDQPLDYYKYWAGSARRLGQTEEMRRGYLGLIEIEPDHGPANYYLGRLDLEAQNLDGALAHFRRAQRGQPEASRAWVGEAEVFLRRGERDKARDAIDHAVELEPDDPEVRRVRALTEPSDDSQD